MGSRLQLSTAVRAPMMHSVTFRVSMRAVPSAACIRCPPVTNQGPLPRQDLEWLRANVLPASRWPTPAVLDILLETGLSCTSEDVSQRLELAMVLARLRRALDTCTRQRVNLPSLSPRDCVYVIVGTGTVGVQYKGINATRWCWCGAPLVARGMRFPGSALSATGLRGSSPVVTWSCAWSARRRCLQPGPHTRARFVKPDSRLPTLWRPTRWMCPISPAGCETVRVSLLTPDS